ncbi:MAG: glycosyltransferase, partial [Candidatus Adiutrix sp.]
MPAPIAMFAFNRPDLLQKTIGSLAANLLASDSDLTIFCDGPRNEAEKKLTEATQKIAHEATG